MHKHTKILTIVIVAIILIVTMYQFFHVKKNAMSQNQPNYIYKMLTKKQWSETQNAGILIGSDMDINDGYIHLSTAKQVERIANKYFPNMADGYLLKIRFKDINDIVKWEPNSKGELFVHAYGDIKNSFIVNIYLLSVSEFNFDNLEN